MSAVALNAAALARIGDRVAVPRYDRSALSVGIVHFGVGGFHRAHQAMYLDTLMNDGQAHDWAICGVGVLEGDRAMSEALAAQDGLYTLVAKHPDGGWDARVIGSLIDYRFAPDDPEGVIARLSDPATRIVSLTITEGGYPVDEATGRFDPRRPDVAADLAGQGPPSTVFGLVVAALDRRRAAGTPPFTVVSCDNLQGNGRLAREAFTGFARARDLELGAWIAAEVRFPNAMVDRITPRTTDADRAAVRDRYGIEDRWPVVCEPFDQWVLEDAFTAGRPALEDAGVQLVDDVEPYELMKLRLLNAGHQALAYFAHLCGYRYVHDAAADPLIQALLREYMAREGAPTLPEVPRVNLDRYQAELLERFANPGIGDTVARLCAESSDRIPQWLLPVVRAQLERGGELHRSAAIVASWARYAEGTDEQGQPIDVVDNRREPVMARAARQRDEPLAFLADPELFGDLAAQPSFTAPYLAALNSLHAHGARATLESLVSGPLA